MRFRGVLGAPFLGTAGSGVITGLTVEFDDTGGWTGSAFFFDRPGLIQVNCSATKAAGTPTGRLTVHPSLNGVLRGGSGPAGSAAVCGASYATVLEVAENDVLQLAYTHTGLATPTFVASETHLSLSRVGPKAWT